MAPLAHSVTHTEALRSEVARMEPQAAAHGGAVSAPVPQQAEARAPVSNPAPQAEAVRPAPVTFASPPPAMAQAEAPRGAPVTFAGPPPGVQFDGRMGVQALRMPSEAEPMTTYAAVQASTVTTTETVARQEAAPAPVEVQTPAPPREDDSESRREKLKARLKAVRENPRPEPLPATVAEAGQRAVERITHLQAELTKVKAANLTLTQDLEVARRQAEKATEEARLRMDEARRLSAEMEGRVKLLADLERELASLEGERDEALLSLQESRQALQAAAKEHEALEQVVTKGKLALADSLAEEERLAVELEGAKDESASLRRAVETLQGERDVLAQQVASLTAERAELLEARKALESVHRALSQATVR
ncbi:extensin-like protein [Corallococcus sp. CA049B]|uniref:extensin-like protein n=1 Tax=Corallococcus sp. CA049B TaxID=2316730 RepID=UPI001F34AC3D|nr:extensin-like protein [Corallococcus sp. CA049B]